MSKETNTARRDTSIPPRKVSLRREDSGYNSVIGTPAGTPSVMNGGRRTSRVDRDSLALIPESSHDDQEVTPGSCPTISFMEHASSCNTALPHETSSGNNRHLQGQLSAPDEENTTHSAPMACGGLTVPSFKRTFSMEAGYYKNYYSGGAFYTKVSKKAEEIISKFEKMRMDSSETVHTQSPSPVEQPEEENIIQYPVPEVSTPSMGILQRQLSEFPLDQSVLTPGQDGYYLEDRDYNIVRQAGAGGSACCNLGNDKVKSTQFIIKKPKKSCSEEERQDVMRESRILQEISHDNVIRFYGVVEDLQDHCFKIFLEYADETCGDINYLFCENEDRESFSGNIALIMLYVQQMLYAVDYLHWTTGILHLDIKGKNIVVCNGGYRVKLIDFGTACKANGALPQKTGWTPVFAAPEVNNQSQPPKFSADIWSVMCVAVEMVTGNLPWPEESNHQTAVYKIGCYEDDQITELVQHDEYWDKYSYYQEHHDMYQELVNMWKMVFRKDSSSRPSANDLLNLNWMKEMELNGESILHELVSGEEEQPCVEQSHSVENESVGILINPSPVDYSSQGYHEDSMSGHGYGQPGRSSPYQSTSPHLSLSQGYPLSAGHSPTGSDSQYYDCNSSFSGRNDTYLAEPRFLQSGPSSLPALGSYHHHPAMLNSTSYTYHSSTPVMDAAVDRLRDFSDGRDDSSSSRGRSRSFSMQGKPPDIEQVTGKRRKSLCYIGSSKSDPINVLNASGIMDSINKTDVKRVNSLIYVSEGPKTDSPVSSPRTEEQPLQSLVPGRVEITPQQSRCHRLSSSDVDTPTSSITSSVADSGYSRSFEEHIIKRSVSVDQTPSHLSRLSLPDRDEHKPDGCSEPSEAIPHTIQISSPTSNKTQQIEVHGSTTVKELIKMTQHSKQSDSIILKLDSTTVKSH